MQDQPPRETNWMPDQIRGTERRLTLTRRESEVLERVRRGVENKAIAFELGVSLQSVKEHVSVLLRKFGVANRTSLAEAASRLAVTGERGVDQNWLPQFFRGAEPQICVLRGPELRYEAVNETFRRAVGNRPVIGRTMRESFPELVGQSIFERVERVYATGEPEIEHEAERSWDRGNGIESRQVDLVLQPLRDEDGNVNGVISFAVDVTDVAGPRRRAELIREEFGAVLDLVPSGVLVVDDSGRIVTMNAAALRIARSPIDTARPAPERFAGVFAARDATGTPLVVLGTPVARALRGETVEDEIQIFSGGDPLEEVRLRASTRPLRDDDGKIRGAVAVFTEV
jgi:PAS domain S-box-containing protein